MLERLALLYHVIFEQPEVAALGKDYRLVVNRAVLKLK
jgi:hypothetical protein